jgi:hypothetical protein
MTMACWLTILPIERQKGMTSRYIAIAALALSLGGLAAEYRVQRASRFRHYYSALHEEEPELNAWQRVLVSLALTTTN